MRLLLVASGWGLITMNQARLERWNFQAHSLTSFCPSVVCSRDSLCLELEMATIKGKQASPCWNLQKKEKLKTCDWEQYWSYNIRLLGSPALHPQCKITCSLLLFLQLQPTHKAASISGLCITLGIKELQHKASPSCLSSSITGPRGMRKPRDWAITPLLLNNTVDGMRQPRDWEKSKPCH